MTIGVLLPHTKLYGGVKRFLELGNIFVGRGHRFVVFTPDGAAPSWFDYRGEMATFDQLAGFQADALMTTTVDYVPLMSAADCRHRIFYHVRLREKLRQVLKTPGIEIFACSGNIVADDRRRYGIDAFAAVGGVNPVPLNPHPERHGGEPFVVMAYGRLAESSKGTKYVVRACEKLYRKGLNVKLLLYDTPQNEKMRRKIEAFSCSCPYDFVVGHPFGRNQELFERADLFVSAENPKQTGWNNTVAEAMNFGIPVIATTAGTADLLDDGLTGLLTPRRSGAIARRIRRMMEDPELRARCRAAAKERIGRYSWEHLATAIEQYLKQ